MASLGGHPGDSVGGGHHDLGRVGKTDDSCIAVIGISRIEIVGSLPMAVRPGTGGELPASGRSLAPSRSVEREITTAAVHNLQFDSAVDAEDVFSRLPANIGISTQVGVSIRFRVWEQRTIPSRPI